MFDCVFREKVSAGLDCRLDAQQELLDLVLKNLRFCFRPDFSYLD